MSSSHHFPADSHFVNRHLSCFDSPECQTISRLIFLKMGTAMKKEDRDCNVGAVGSLGVACLLYLILNKLGGVLQVHVLFARRVVVRCQSQAAQRVPACAPVPDFRQQLVTQSRCQGHPPCSYPQVLTALDHTLWSSLRGGETSKQERGTSNNNINNHKLRNLSLCVGVYVCVCFRC